jgi:cyanophycinase-like exopeptidase
MKTDFARAGHFLGVWQKIVFKHQRGPQVRRGAIALGRHLAVIWLLFVSLSIAAQGVVVVAGGGREGDKGDTSTWSYKLYRKLIENGDKNADGVVKVAVLTTLLEVNDPSWYRYAEAPTTANPPGLGLTHAQAIATAQQNDVFLPDYFQWIGSATGANVMAFNVEVGSVADANNSARVAPVASADVIFIKGGDQGAYFDWWNGTLLETHIRSVVQTRSGAIGGTSAGAMSQAQYCFCGSGDLISADVLADAKSVYLDDVSQPGTSGIHTDFLSFVPNAVIETHYTQRGRMGRLIGVLARAVADSNNRTLLGIGLEQKTGLVIRAGIAEVIGQGEVAFFKETAASVLRRDAGRPLFFTNLILDRLTEGWRYDLNARAPITTTVPTGVSTVSYAGDSASNSGALSISGASEADKNRFDRVVSYFPNNYTLVAGTGTPYIKNAVGFSDAGNATNRPDKQESIFRALYDLPHFVGVLSFSGGSITRNAAMPDVLQFSGTLAAIVLDGKSVTHKGLSPSISSYASTGGSLRAAALSNITVHVLADTALASRGVGFNSRLHQLVAITGGSSTAIAEQEVNDTRSTAQDLSAASFPVQVTGKISSSSDVDHYKLSLASSGSLSVDLSMPSNKDYDIYLLSLSGVIEARSTRNGNGLAEAIRFTNTSSGTNTYYVKVVGYNGANSTTSYLLNITK